MKDSPYMGVSTWTLLDCRMGWVCFQNL